MADFEKLTKNLEQRGFQVSRFATAREAAAYLDSQISGTTVAFGGSMTLKELDLYPILSRHNRVIWHWEGGTLPTRSPPIMTPPSGGPETLPPPKMPSVWGRRPPAP